MQSEPETSELDASTPAGDRADESGKGAGGSREGTEESGPGEETIAAGNASSWDNLMPSAMTCSIVWLRLFSLLFILLLRRVVPDMFL